MPFAAIMLLMGAGGAVAADYWRDAPTRQAEVNGQAPAHYRALSLDWTALRESLSSHPRGIGARLALPTPDGRNLEFVLSDSGVMPAGLQARYPDIRSYVGTEATGMRARIDISMLGLHAIVHDPSGTWLLRPEQAGSGSRYLSFLRSEVPAAPALRCATHGDLHAHERGPLPKQLPGVATVTGAALRTYRAAVAANHHWVQAVAGAMSPPQPPSVAIGLAGVVNVMNRINEVYGQDFSIRMTLVPNNDLVIYPAALGDPYVNNEDAIDQNGPNLNAMIGSANYDIGHVFTTGGGGLAGLGVVCSGWKAEGTTGLPDGATLQSDLFYIDYVAHEIGHQFGGDHTYNSCDGENAGPVAFEPGSGSTIQAYAGICGAASDLQSNSDAYFHAASLGEMGGYSGTGIGNSCAQVVPRTFAPPSAVAGSAATIPANTPYVLTASASSPAPAAALTYTWEQYDLGPANPDLAVDPGTGPIQRSWPPSTSPRRYLPRLSNLLEGSVATGEILPTTTRTMTYRLTVRDNLAGGGATASADRALAVVASAGPFVVTAPSTPVTWTYAITPAQTVQWNVASTDQPPVSCGMVDIDLVAPSADGRELDRLALLASGVPNNGSRAITVPNVPTTMGRVRVACADNLFFNISARVTVVGSDLLFRDGFENPASAP